MHSRQESDLDKKKDYTEVPGFAHIPDKIISES